MYNNYGLFLMDGHGHVLYCSINCSWTGWKQSKKRMLNTGKCTLYNNKQGPLDNLVAVSSQQSRVVIGCGKCPWRTSSISVRF